MNVKGGSTVQYSTVQYSKVQYRTAMVAKHRLFKSRQLTVMFIGTHCILEPKISNL